MPFQTLINASPMCGLQVFARLPGALGVAWCRWSWLKTPGAYGAAGTSVGREHRKRKSVVIRGAKYLTQRGRRSQQDQVFRVGSKGRPYLEHLLVESGWSFLSHCETSGSFSLSHHLAAIACGAEAPPMWRWRSCKRVDSSQWS